MENTLKCDKYTTRRRHLSLTPAILSLFIILVSFFPGYFLVFFLFLFSCLLCKYLPAACGQRVLDIIVQLPLCGIDTRWTRHDARLLLLLPLPLPLLLALLLLLLHACHNPF